MRSYGGFTLLNLKSFPVTLLYYTASEKLFSTKILRSLFKFEHTEGFENLIHLLPANIFYALFHVRFWLLLQDSK